MRTLFFSRTGALFTYGNGELRIADLNPEVELRWGMSRWEMFKIGCRCILAAVR